MLVEEKLAACVNILGNVKSIYRWKDKVEDTSEVLLIVKTQISCYTALEKRVKEKHSYECPEIVRISIQEGFGPYLDWIQANTQI